MAQKLLAERYLQCSGYVLDVVKDSSIDNFNPYLLRCHKLLEGCGSCITSIDLYPSLEKALEGFRLKCFEMEV